LTNFTYIYFCPIYPQNLAYVSPNEERAEKMKFKGDRYVDRVDQKKSRKEHVKSNPLPKDTFANHNVFK
jgi:hypothetical protein